MNVNIDKSRQKDIPAQIDFFRAGVEFRVLIGNGDFKNFAAFYENRFIGANTVFLKNFTVIKALHFIYCTL